MGALLMRYSDHCFSICLFLSAFFLCAYTTLFPPTSAYALENTEPVCIQCHSTLPEKYSQPVVLWRSSIHAENGIFCNGCHGGDPKDSANAMSPSRGFLGAPKEASIPGFCGRCHVGVLKDYLASAHGRMLGKGGATCVTCHGNHSVTKASLELINEKSCSRCHSFERAGIIRAAMEETDITIIAIDKRINTYKKTGTDTEKLEKALFAERNRFHTLFHNVNVELVKKESSAIQDDLKKTQAKLDILDDRHLKRRLAGAAAVASMLLIALLLHLFKKTFE